MRVKLFLMFSDVQFPGTYKYPFEGKRKLLENHIIKTPLLGCVHAVVLVWDKIENLTFSAMM
jgi:hypothetical protein